MFPLPRSSAMPGAGWRKSSHSGQDGDCIEAGNDAGTILIRDSKDPDGPVLAVTARAWRLFTGVLRSLSAQLAGPSGKTGASVCIRHTEARALFPGFSVRPGKCQAYQGFIRVLLPQVMTMSQSRCKCSRILELSHLRSMCGVIWPPRCYRSAGAAHFPSSVAAD